MGRKKYKEIRPTFFKVLIGDFSNHLRIPPAFVMNNFDRSSPLGKCILKSPTGGYWVVNVEENGDDRLHFGRGWKDFVKDHCLAAGDFLVFKYCGKSKFRTKIYDRTCCEKIFTKHNANGNKPTTSARPEKTKAVVEVYDKRLSRCSTPLRRSSFDSHNSHFIMPWTNFRKEHVTIPKVLAREKNLLTKWAVVITDPSGKSWPVELTKSNCDGRLRMGGGMWVHFWRENELEIGDTLVFEFTTPTPTAMQVHIFRGCQVEGITSRLYSKRRDTLTFNAATSAIVNKFEAD